MFIRISLLLMTLAATALPASAATFYVNTTLDLPDAAPGNGVCATSASYCSLRAAITETNALVSNDTIVVPGGTYTTTLTGTAEENNASGDFDVYGNLTITGAGSGSTIFQAATSAGVATQRVLEIRPGAVVTITGVTIRYGVSGPNYPFMGGGIHSRGTLTLTNCVVRDNEARINLSATDSADGGGINSTGSLTLNSTTVTNNQVRRTSTAGFSVFGGGIFASGTVNINYSTISSNRVNSVSGAGGGAGLMLKGQFTAAINGSSFASNTSNAPNDTSGAGIGASTSSGNSTLSISSSSITQNTITAGSNNSGGGLDLYVVQYGLTVTIDRTTISGNSVAGWGATGGGLYAGTDAGPINLTMTNSTVANNFSAESGGGIYLATLGSSPSGAGVYNITNSTISDNGAYQNGGGVYAIQNNYAATFQTTLYFSTVAGNVANLDNYGYEGGGGLYSTTYGFYLKNSVVARNYVYGYGYGYEVYGNFTSNSYNHVESFSGGSFLGGGNETTGDPMLSALGNYGGPTLTRHPLTGSPLIGRIPYGVNGCGTTVSLDQRGAARPDVGYLYCDKGAVEVIGPN